jgi:hypothetical protein
MKITCCRDVDVSYSRTFLQAQVLPHRNILKMHTCACDYIASILYTNAQPDIGTGQAPPLNSLYPAKCSYCQWRDVVSSVRDAPVHKPFACVVEGSKISLSSWPSSTITGDQEPSACLLASLVSAARKAASMMLSRSSSIAPLSRRVLGGGSNGFPVSASRLHLSFASKPSNGVMCGTKPLPRLSCSASAL